MDEEFDKLISLMTPINQKTVKLGQNMTEFRLLSMILFKIDKAFKLTVEPPQIQTIRGFIQNKIDSLNIELDELIQVCEQERIIKKLKRNGTHNLRSLT